MLKFLLYLICSCNACLTFGQISAGLCIAKMKDGSVYHGKKLSEEDGIISMRIPLGDTISFHRLLTKEFLDQNNAIFFPNNRYHRTTGRYFSFQFGFNPFDVSENARVSSHLQLSYLWRISPYFSAGPVLGFEFNEATVAGFAFNTSFSSLGVSTKYYLNSSKKRLYAFIRFGYGFPSEEVEEGATREHTGGLNFIGGFGMQFPVKRKSSFHINIGQYYQETRGSEFFLDNLGNEIDTNFDIVIKRLVLRFAWDFK